MRFFKRTYSAGGGGAKSQSRREKIAAKNLRLNGQRFRREQEELGRGTKGSSKKEDIQMGSSKIKSVRSKAKYDSEVTKGAVKKVIRKETTPECEQAQNVNSDVHPSRKKLLNCREHK